MDLCLAGVRCSSYCISMLAKNTYALSGILTRKCCRKGLDGRDDKKCKK